MDSQASLFAEIGDTVWLVMHYGCLGIDMRSVDKSKTICSTLTRGQHKGWKYVYFYYGHVSDDITLLYLWIRFQLVT